MGKAAKKLNFIIEEDVCQDLESLIPAGKRSKVVNDALRKELELIRRRNVLNSLISVSHTGKRFTNDAITEVLAKDRRMH